MQPLRATTMPRVRDTLRSTYRRRVAVFDTPTYRQHVHAVTGTEPSARTSPVAAVTDRKRDRACYPNLAGLLLGVPTRLSVWHDTSPPMTSATMHSLSVSARPRLRLSCKRPNSSTATGGSTSCRCTPPTANDRI